MVDRDEFDALALEYQRDYGTARGDLDISDIVNNPFVNCVYGIFRLGFTEKALDLPLREIGMLGDDLPNPFLVTEDTI